jgi:hypothetical protein
VLVQSSEQAGDIELTVKGEGLKKQVLAINAEKK